MSTTGTETVAPEHWAAPQPEWGPWNRAQTMAALAEVIPGDDGDAWTRRAIMLAFIATCLHRRGLEVATGGPRARHWRSDVVARIARRFAMRLSEASTVLDVVVEDLFDQELRVAVIDPGLAWQSGVVFDAVEVARG